MILNLVVAPRRPGLAVLSVLKDWSALGLVSEVFWVTAEAALPAAGSPLPVLRIRTGTAEAVDLQGELARWGSVTRARICVLDPMTRRDHRAEPWGYRPTGDSRVGEDSSTADLVELAQNASQQVSAAAPGTPQRLVHCLVTALGPSTGGTSHERSEWGSSGDGAARSEDGAARAGNRLVRPAVQQGWHGVLIAPQESQAPLTPRRQVRATDDPHDLAMHWASGLAAVLGLWQGFDETPLDDLRTGTAGQVRLSQGFLQVRDASIFGASLRSALTDVYPDLPAPVADNRMLPRVQDAHGAAAAAADGLFAQHGWVLHRDRQALPPRTARQIGAWQAITMFAGFLWAALLRSPQHWWQRLVSRGSRKLASVTQRTVFGADSEYDVVVRGWLPSGQLATAEQINDAARSIMRRLDTGARHDEAAATFPELWRDFAGLTLDLADGGRRVPDVPAPHLAGQPAIIGNAPAIAPGPWEAFTDIPPHLAAALGVREISASDLRTTELVTQRLERITEQRGDLALEANALRSAILAWSRQTQQASFAGRVGMRLAAAQSGLRQEVGTIHQSLAGLEREAEPGAEFAEEQKRLSRRARWLLWIGVAVIGALLLAWNRAWIAGGTALRWMLVVLVVELLAQLWLFLRGQQSLFKLLHRQQQVADEAEIQVRNLAAALRELQRVDAASQQFVGVAEAFGSFVAQPLGGSAPPPRGIDLPADHLPQSVKIGTVPVDEEALQELLGPLRNRLFGVGWMEEPFAQFLAGAEAFTLRPGAPPTSAASGGAQGAARGPGAAQGMGAAAGRDPGRLLAVPAVDPDAPLRRWTAFLRTNGTPAALGDDIWDRALQLVGNADFLAAAGIGDLPTVWAGGDGPVHGLGAGLDQARAAAAQFDTAILTPAARSGRGRLVDPAAVTAIGRSEGMSRRHLLVILGQAVDVGDLDVAEAEAPVPPPAEPLGGPRF